MRSLPQRGLLIVFTLLVFLGGNAAWLKAEPKVQLVKEIDRKEAVKPPNIFERAGAFLFGIKLKEDRFSVINGVAVDAQDNLYLADAENRRIVALDKQGKGTLRGDIGKTILKNPIGAAVDSRRRVYVTDSVLNQLLIFTEDGVLAAAIEGSGSEKGKFLRPSGVLVDEKEKRIIVSDTGNHRLQIFDLAGGFLKTVGAAGGGAGEFSFPTFLAKDSQGRIYVVDTINSRVQIFDRDLKYAGQFGGHGDILGYFGRPKGIAIDAQDRIYIADAIFNVVTVFDREKGPLMFFDGSANSKKKFFSPMGLAVNAQGEIIVADSLNKSIEIFKINW